MKKILHNILLLAILLHPLGDPLAKEIPFKFDDVSKGFYGIRCFQDLNSNKILDKGFLGPSEPWGMTWQRKKPAAWPVFKDIAFMVDSDIHNITIKVE